MAESSFSKGCNVTCGVLFALIVVPLLIAVFGCGGIGALLKQVDSVRQEVQNRPAPPQR